MEYYFIVNTLIKIFSIILTISENDGIKITKFKLPEAIHNGTGPVELICEYKIENKENGLVIKWYHNMEQIYQWIPPMIPQDIGIISGLTEYPIENINQPLSRSIIRLKKVNLAMTGDYTCSVSTFHEDDSKAKTMTVYVPDDDLNIQANFYNKSHINLTCIAKGAHPRPNLTIIVDNQQSKRGRVHVEKFLDEYYRDYKDYPWIRQEALLPIFFNLAIIQCEINIPGTGYRKREKLVYYPDKYINRNCASSKKNYSIIFILLIILIA
ncbi:uncharacterized protein [Chelonus insularis]|uniref:uncharacterized protein n=1 Tax=Chelonus insularis TaxID=460826 RepID=UPI00158C4F34|nr:uncharacterized protein LOC118067936 [Chelonus insularis]